MDRAEISYYASNARNLILEDSPTVKNMTPEEKCLFLHLLIGDLQDEYARQKTKC